MQFNRFGDAHDRAANGSGNVTAVPVATLQPVCVGNRGERANCAPLELRMRCANPGVNDVDVDAGPVSRIGVCCAERQCGLVDSIESPDRRGLSFGDAYYAILLDVGNVGILSELLGYLCRHMSREASESTRVEVIRRKRTTPREATHGAFYVPNARLEDDDVLVFDLPIFAR
jgi:hypothetical protein